MSIQVDFIHALCPRTSLGGEVYHVLNRANVRLQIFDSDSERRPAGGRRRLDVFSARHHALGLQRLKRRLKSRNYLWCIE